jgi:plastocyanin
MPRLSRAALAGAFLLALSSGGCSSPSRSGSASVPKIRTIPEPSTGPFVISAIDNHFHDVHPSEHKTIAAGRPVVVKNYGLHRHNFTLVGTGISEDIPPGDDIEIGTLPPGHYTLFCKYHVSVGMAGAFDVAP